MTRTTLGGDDPDHQLSPEEKDRLERELRKEARRLLMEKRSKESKKLLNRARNISRRASKRADHH
jgi:hypothetical protein